MTKPFSIYAVICKNGKIHIGAASLALTTSHRAAVLQCSRAFTYYHDECGPHRIATFTERRRGRK